MKQSVLALFLVFSIQLFSQSEIKFDTIFSQWNNKHSPGVAAGMIHNGEIIYLKGFGIANLETGEPITPKTKFQVDDLAKQFTVLGILLLKEQGKIALEDDIRVFLPELPEYSEPIKIKHLVNHSSGLHILYPIKELMGIRSNDLFTQEDALKIIRSQKKLNFVPGTAYSYHTSDTEIILMTELIAKASGQSFIEFIKEHIFEPLEMLNSTFDADRAMLSNLAKSYTLGDEIAYSPINDLTLGATNLYTTAEDLAKWFQAFYKKGKLFEIVQQLDNYVTLDSGKEFASTWGKMTLGRYFDHPERGLEKMSWQYGLKGGYACNFFRFPSHDLISFVLGNNDRYNGMPTMLLANEILEDYYTEPVEIDYNKIDFKSLSNKKLKKHEGTYWDKTNGIVRELFVKNDTLRYKRLNNNQETPLLALSDNKFQFYLRGDNEIIITMKKDHFMLSSLGSNASRYDKIETMPDLSLSDLKDFSGTFFNKALDIVYTFTVEENLLTGANFRIGKTTFYPVVEDVFRSNTYMLSGIHFLRDTLGQVNGFKIDTDGVKNLYFKKI